MEQSTTGRSRCRVLESVPALIAILALAAGPSLLTAQVGRSGEDGEPSVPLLTAVTGDFTRAIETESPVVTLRPVRTHTESQRGESDGPWRASRAR